MGLGLEEMGTERLCAKKGRVDCGHPTPTNVVLVCVTDGVVCCTIIHVGFCLLSRDWNGHGARCCGVKRSCAMVSVRCYLGLVGSEQADSDLCFRSLYPSKV